MSLNSYEVSCLKTVLLCLFNSQHILLLTGHNQLFDVQFGEEKKKKIILHLVIQECSPPFVLMVTEILCMVDVKWV